ncbi:MAG: DUF2207 domain-containing protein, partial [Actinomycetota bacterium]
MPIARRRRVAVVLVVIASLVVGVAALIAAAAGDVERIDGYWTSATLTDEGLEVVEVIDYDFGPQLRRGIYREIPDLIPTSVIVTSPTAPTDTLVTDYFSHHEIRVGDPLVTISGRHRYRLEYTIERSAVVQNGLFSWDAVGLEWTVPIRDIDVHLAVPAPTDIACVQGDPWSPDDCAVASSTTGALTFDLADLSAGRGATVSARIGSGAVPALPIEPSGPADDPGSGVLAPAFIATIAALIGGLIAIVATRR